MKKIILTLSLLVAIGTVSFAQCDKNVELISSKTDHLDASGTVQRTVDESAKIDLTKTTIDIAINDEKKMHGTITSSKCDWKVPFKEGKSIITATMTNPNGDEKNVSITIEGKDGKLTLFFDMEEEPNDKVRVSISSFKEKV
ncbi:hypothetical protein [Mucilaginibacter sp.]|uniref:hypothetical protein n=1 Tax=Mucilaginibacter sp. TaxID=1882438 RepID=UPI003D114338